MIDKRIEFCSTDGLGTHFAEAISITPRGGGLEKIAGRRHPEIEAYLRQLRPDPRYQYVLMTPMGSYEYWGANVNSDLFPEASLSYNRDIGNPEPVIRALEKQWLEPFGKSVPPGTYRDFGFKTFLNALRYRHHINKDPSISYGGIDLSVWNPVMHRVEVIAKHDREKAKRVGAEEIIVDIDNGKPRMISMGCRVPFDVCTNCGYISFRPSDRCACLKYGGGTKPDGKVVAMVNFFPSFHDLSDVIVPAAKEAGVLEKVARVIRPASFYISHDKKADEEKKADIDKEVLPNTAHKSMEDCMASEPDLPADVLKAGPLGDLLATLSALGIVLKPMEFQTAALNGMGFGRYADELASRGMVFTPQTGAGDAPPTGQFNSALANRVAGMLPERSAFLPHLQNRIMRITIVGVPKTASTKATRPAPDSDALRKVASAYAGYRQSLRSMPAMADAAVSEHPRFFGRHFFSDILTDAMEKRSSKRFDSSLVPLYVFNAFRGSVVEPPHAWDFSMGYHSPARALIIPSS